MKHVAIFDKKSIIKIFAGEKTIDLRLSQIRVAPFGKVSSGDLVLIKESGGKIVGQFRVLRVITFDNLSLSQIEKIKRDYNRYLKMDKTFWHEKQEARFGTLLYISEVQPVLVPTAFRKRDRRGWVVLGN